MENEKPLAPIMTWFSVIQDPRIERNKLYPLDEIIVITILAAIAMAQGWEDIERYGRAKKAWLRQFSALENGIPRHDVYRRVMTRIAPEEIEACFMRWVRAGVAYRTASCVEDDTVNRGGGIEPGDQRTGNGRMPAFYQQPACGC
jgi:hypothetical protein